MAGLELLCLTYIHGYSASSGEIPWIAASGMHQTHINTRASVRISPDKFSSIVSIQSTFAACTNINIAQTRFAGRRELHGGKLLSCSKVLLPFTTTLMSVCVRVFVWVSGGISGTIGNYALTAATHVVLITWTLDGWLGGVSGSWCCLADGRGTVSQPGPWKTDERQQGGWPFCYTLIAAPHPCHCPILH